MHEEHSLETLLTRTALPVETGEELLMLGGEARYFFAEEDGRHREVGILPNLLIYARFLAVCVKESIQSWEGLPLVKRLYESLHQHLPPYPEEVKTVSLSYLPPVRFHTPRMRGDLPVEGEESSISLQTSFLFPVEIKREVSYEDATTSLRMTTHFERVIRRDGQQVFYSIHMQGHPLWGAYYTHHITHGSVEFLIHDTDVYEEALGIPTRDGMQWFDLTIHDEGILIVSEEYSPLEANVKYALTHFIQDFPSLLGQLIFS